MKLQLLSLLPLAAVASASWSKNLNYRSPSEHHPALGISIHKVVKRNDPAASYPASSLNFTHGVASGDPYPDSVILWTRVAPQSDNSQSNLTVTGYAPLFDHDNEKYVQVSRSPICVEYKVYDSKNCSTTVDSGKVYTSSDVDFTVKVEAKNLKPYSTYYYQFNVCDSNNKSPLGRTKTTPHADDDITNVSLAIFSCSNYPFGFFNAYGNPVRKVCFHNPAGCDA
jgi:alkaline phosphatase D